MIRDQKVLQTLALLAVVPSLRKRIKAVESMRPADGSDAALDQLLPQGSVAQVLATQMLGVAAEHLFIWYLLLEIDVFPRHAHLTLLRSSLEPAVTARWLLAGPTSTARTCRGLALSEEGLGEFAKITASFAKSCPEATTLADDHLAQITADMVEMRAGVDCAGFPRRAPPTCDLVRDFAVHLGAKGDWLYRVLSSPAHGNAISPSVSEFGELLPSSLPGTTRRRVGPNTSLGLDATKTAVETVRLAIGDLERYMGIGLSGLDQARASSSGELDLGR